MRRRPQALLGDRIPLEDHIADDVVLTRGNGVLAMFAVEGVFPDTADGTDVARWFEQLHNALKNIAAEDVELTVYQCRGEAEPASCQAGLHRAAFARELEAAYRERLYGGSLYQNRLYLAVQLHPSNAAAQGLARFLAEARRDPRAGIEERKNRLGEICGLIEAQLGGFGLRRLGYVRRGPVVFDEVAEAIVFAMTGVWRPIGATTGRMGHAMFSEALRFRHRHLELDGPGAPAYAAMFAFKEYPATTWPGMFHGLATAPYRSTLMQSYRFLSNAAGIGAVGRKQHKMLAAGDKALSQSEALTLAADELMSRKWVLGDHSLVLIAFADSRQSLAEVGNAAWRDLASCGLVATRMMHALPAAWLSMLPGGGFWRPRPGFVKSSNFAAFAPLYNWPSGPERGHWPGPPVAVFRTLAGTPYRFHWQVGDVGNTLVTGATGSGKTTLVAFLIAMTAGRARIVALDHKRGWDPLVRRLGGDSYGAGGLPEISGVLSSLSGLTAGAYSANHVYTPTDAGWASRELISNANSIAGEQGAAQAAYGDLQSHAAALQALRDHLTAASSPKDVQDAQAQIQLEQVWTTNEAAQLAAVNSAYAAQRDALVQRDNEKMSQDIAAFIASAPADAQPE